MLTNCYFSSSSRFRLILFFFFFSVCQIRYYLWIYKHLFSVRVSVATHKSCITFSVIYKHSIYYISLIFKINCCFSFFFSWLGAGTIIIISTILMFDVSIQNPLNLVWINEFFYFALLPNNNFSIFQTALRGFSTGRTKLFCFVKFCFLFLLLEKGVKRLRIFVTI